MGNLLYLALAVGLSTVGVLVLWLVRHRPRSMQAGMDAFSRELAALAPPDARAVRHETHLDEVRPVPIRPRAADPARRGAPGAGRRTRRPDRAANGTRPADRRRTSS